MKRVRIDFGDRRRLPSWVAVRCEACGAVAKVDAHHKKPVWTYALDQTLKYQLRDFHDLSVVTMMFLKGQFDAAECNQDGNLINLCHTCHIEADKAAYAHWKAYYLDHYPVVFGVKSMERVRLIMSGVKP